MINLLMLMVTMVILSTLQMTTTIITIRITPSDLIDTTLFLGILPYTLPIM